MMKPTTTPSTDSSNTTAVADVEKTVRGLVNDNIPLVKAVVTYYLKKYNLLFDCDKEDFKKDLIHLGIIGLHRAAAKYDPSRGPFSSYAWPWIAKFVRQELADTYAHRRSTISLNAPLRQDEEDGASLLDTLSDDRAVPIPDALARREVHERLRAAVANLPARERLIIERHFGLRDDDPRPFREIGEELEVSPQRVQFLLKKTLQTLRHELRPVA